MRFLLLTLLFAPLAAQTQQEFDTAIWRWEGYRSHPYRLRGQWHIGYAHKLEPGSWSYYTRMSRDDLMMVYRIDFAQAYVVALSGIPNWEDQPREVRILLVGLAYNTGRTGFHRFTRFRDAVIRRDYLRAARELRESKWAKQVGEKRLAESISCLTRAAFEVFLSQ